MTIKFYTSIIKKLSFFSLIGLLYGCTQFISEYDEKSLLQTEKIAIQVDRLFSELLYENKEDRTFVNFAQDFQNIEVGLYALKLRQETRSLNQLTIKQVEILISLWKQEIDLFKKSSRVSDFQVKNHRRQYYQLFLAILKGEESKQHEKNN